MLCVCVQEHVTGTNKMAVDERSSPQTGDQLRTKNTNNTPATETACEGAAASDQAEVCKSVVVAVDHEVDQSMLASGVSGRTGRGRRKQCRPIRVCFSHDDDNNDEMIENKPPPEVNSLPPPDVAVGLPAQNVCELCGAEETSPEALSTHASNCRGARTDNNVHAGAFPTPYHQLGNELMRGSSDSTLLENPPGSDGPLTEATSMPVDCSLGHFDEPRTGPARYQHRVPEDLNAEDFDLPLDFTLHSDQLHAASTASHQASSSSDPTGVANSSKQPPSEMTSSTVGADAASEDFCELCQKRFCNKYYLRKHRHDVHGVGDTQSQSQQQQHLASSFFPPQDMTLPLLPLTSDALSAHDAFITTSSSTTSTNQQLPFPQTQLMTSPMQPFVLPFQTSTAATTSSLLFQPPADLAAGSSASAAAAGLLPGLTSLMLLNPFASSLALLNSPSSFLHQTSPGAAAAAAYSASSSLNTLAELQKTNAAAAAAAAAVGGGFGGLCDDVAALGALMNPFLPSSDHPAVVDDPLSSSSSHHCELCRKEFCSAYFLAVHRREKHGIATSTACLSDAIRLLAAGGNGRAPAGVLESLGNGSGAEPGEKLQANTPSSGGGRVGKSHGSDRSSTHAETSRSMASSAERTSSSDHVCNLCKKQFPNRYGLVLHLLSAHNIHPEGFGLAGELLQMDGVGGRPQSTASVSGKGSSLTSGGSSIASSSSSKQSDRVSCDVCNKEVCNKYFLKTHKMKVHGLDSAAAAVYNPPPPPLDSTRSEAARSPASVTSSSRQHQQQQQHDEMRKALLMADSQFSAFASHLDFALKSAASSTDPTGSTTGFGVLPPSLQQQPGEPMMTASDIFRLFGLVGSKVQDDPFLSLGPPPPPPLSLQSLLPGADLCSADSLTDAAAKQHHKPVELKIPKHVAGMSSHHHHKPDSVSMQHQQPVQSRVKHSAGGHHNGRHGQAPAPSQPPRPSQTTSTLQGPPSDQELIQSGIDPEAYCELCQKEFCSKYFLRTHRAKIHGMQSAAAGKTDAAASFDHYRPMSQQPAAANPVLQIFPGLPLPTQPLFASSGPTGLLPSTAAVDPSPGDPVAASVSSSQGRAGGGSKEAANATRVTCDVCGKELCNKYFLKTHMAKIHGCSGPTALSSGAGSVEQLDVGDSTSLQETPLEKRGLPEASRDDDHTPRSSPTYDKRPQSSGSFPSLTDHGGNLSELSAADNNIPAQRPHFRHHHSQETDDIRPATDSSENTIKITPDHHQLSSGSEATVEHVLENGGERSFLETWNNNHPPPRNDAASEHVNSNDVNTELSDTDAGHVRGEKRAASVGVDDDDGGVTKRPRGTDDGSDLSPPTVDTTTGIHVTETDANEPASSNTVDVNPGGVIQFVRQSTDSPMHRTKDEKAQTGSTGPAGSSADVDETGRRCSESGVKTQSESSGVRGDWFAAVNGHHPDPPSRDAETEASSWQPDVQQQQQPQQPAPLMQPFIMRQAEPLTHDAALSRSSPGPPEPPPTEMTVQGQQQFAACQLVLPVIRPIRDQLTVEFSVTPVSSD